METKHFALLFILFIIVSIYLMGVLQTIELLYLALRSFLRMLAAYAISIVFSLFFGILIIHNKRAYEFIFPVLDVLQSIPILGFLPFALMFFAEILPGGSFLGPELSSIFLIFTSMTWSLVFAIVESGASITYEMQDLAKILNLKGMRYLTHLVLPISFPQFVSGSIASWGGGWYFLVAAEYLTWGSNPIALPGLGSFISSSAFSYDLISSLLGIVMLAFLVVGMNIYVWQPLLARARRYSYKPSIEEEGMSSESSPFMPLMENIYGKIRSTLERFQKPSEKLLEWLSISPAHSTSHEQLDNTPQYILTGAIVVLFVYLLFFRMPHLLTNFEIFFLIVRSILRIGVAFALALLWTSAVAIFLARNKRAMAILMPLFDLGQSIPAVSVFPIIVIVVVETVSKVFGLAIALEIASILLVITGMQWYLLFNLIRAVQTIPEEIIDISRLLNLPTSDQLKNILVPAIMPAVFVGGLEAIGGGWNASIVSEYIISPDGTPFPMPGIGNFLSVSAAAQNMDGVLLAVCTITLLILIPHQFIWKPLVRESYKYKF